MFVGYAMSMLDQRYGFRGKHFPLKPCGSLTFLKAGKKPGVCPRVKVSQEIGGLELSKFFSQSRRLAIEISQLGPLTPTRASHADSPADLERRGARADLTTEHAP
jgi:hypothetical protein